MTAPCYVPGIEAVQITPANNSNYLNKTDGIQLIIISTTQSTSSLKFRRGGVTYQELGFFKGAFLLNPGDGFRITYTFIATFVQGASIQGT